MTVLSLSEVTARISDVEAIALTLCHENGFQNSEARYDRLLIGAVIANRVRSGYRGRTPKQVVLEPRQFSCWNPSSTDANHLRLVARASRWLADGPREHDSLEQHALWVAEAVVGDWLGYLLPPRTRHYHARGNLSGYPDWSRGETPVLETRYHLYYDGIA